MKRIRLIGISFTMVCAASAIATASASARSFEFRAETYPAEVRGTSSFPSFEFGGLVIACKHASFDTNEEGAPNPTKESSVLIVHPRYTECRGSLEPAGTFAAAVRTEGCNFRFHAVTPNEKTGFFDIICEGGKAIEVEPLGISGCAVTIPPQSGLAGIEYVNEAGPPKTIKVNAAVEKIKYRASSACGLGVVEGESRYRGSAVFNGFKPGTTEADGLEVHPSHP